MKDAAAYAQKVAAFKASSLFLLLDADSRTLIERLAEQYRFTLQELYFLVEAARDLKQWQESELQELWSAAVQSLPTLEDKRTEKRQALDRLKGELSALRRKAKIYPTAGLPPPLRPQLESEERADLALVLGSCPVYSERTNCCGLKTLDVVENCSFNCSYCSIQTFYGDKIVFHKDLPRKLAKLNLDPKRCYHIGVGQSSDALAWGNRNGLLDALTDFAAGHPRVLLELKSKSAAVDYFLNHRVPSNLVCSWTLNSQTIAQNEEHFAAPVTARLEAARQAAGAGVKVAFHFHPLVYYHNWEADYREVTNQLLATIDSVNVLFLSLGTVTLIKPVLKAIRERGAPTKISQMELVPDPHGRLTYPDTTKVTLYRALLEALAPWREKVFMYLCMEKASIWEEVFGRSYQNNALFEKALLTSAFLKTGTGACFEEE